MSSSKEIYLLRDFAAGVSEFKDGRYSHVDIFDPSWWTVDKYNILYTRIQFVRGRYGVLGLRQINTCRKVPLQDNYLDEWYHWIWLYKVIQSYMLEII